MFIALDWEFYFTYKDHFWRLYFWTFSTKMGVFDNFQYQSKKNFHQNNRHFSENLQKYNNTFVYRTLS